MLWEQYRVASGRSANTEREEALFTSMKNNTNQTSDHHPNNIISNILICHHAKNKTDNLKEKHPIYMAHMKA